MNFSHQGDIENRKFLRIPKRYTLRHSRYVPLNADDEVFENTTIDIGGGGLLFSSPVKYNMSELLRLEIDIPEWQKFLPEASAEDKARPSGPFVTKAIVSRVDEVGPSNYAIGARFADLDRKEIWAIMFAINKK